MIFNNFFLIFAWDVACKEICVATKAKQKNMCVSDLVIKNKSGAVNRPKFSGVTW